MADHKPPRLASDERATLCALLQYQRESFVRKLRGVDESSGHVSPVGSGTSLLWLANHMADAEVTWVHRRFAGRSDPGGEPPATTVAGALGRYERIWPRTDEIVRAAVTLDVACPAFDDQPVVNLRWILAHLLEETARHAGHADIVRELADGHTGR